jgi:MFS family permease
MKFTKERITIFIILVTEVLGFSLILPFLPFYAQELGASPLTVGLILTSFSLCQLISAPIMGRLSDHYGRKPLLILSQLSTVVGFLVLGFARSLWMVFLSRIIDGLLGSNFTIAQSYLSDVSSKKNRSKAFGISGAAFGFGFLIGPAIGGFLSQFGYSVPSFIAAGVSFIPIVITAFFLEETVKRGKEFKLSWDIFQVKDFKKFFQNQKLALDFYQFFTFVLTHSIYVSGFALFTERQLGFTSTNVGFVLTYIGLISILLRGVLLSKLIDYFGEHKLQYIGIISIMLAMLGVIFVNQIWLFMIITTLFAFGTGVSRPVMIGEISRKVSGKKQGTVLGVSSSLVSLSNIIGPFVSGLIIEYFFPGSIGIVSLVVLFVGLGLMVWEDRKS